MAWSVPVTATMASTIWQAHSAGGRNPSQNVGGTSQLSVVRHSWAGSHSRTVPSQRADAGRVPSWLNATAVTKLVWPVSGAPTGSPPEEENPDAHGHHDESRSS
jgi:hypothetical protein